MNRVVSIKSICIALILFNLTACSAQSALRDRSGSADSGGAPQRMLIREASLTLEVWEPSESLQEIERTVESLHGYIESKNEPTEGYTYAVIRVPAADLERFLQTISQTGSVSSFSLSSEDVTEQVYDAEGRLKNMLALRERLRELLSRAQSITDIIAIEQALAELQTQIESLEGSLKSLNARVTYARVSLTLERAKVRGPVGYVFDGVSWVIEKLFYLRD